MRLAHLVLAHANEHQLERLVNKLLHKDADIYIHIDKKTNLQPFLCLESLPNVFFIKKRYRIHWGGYSMVEATLAGFEAIADAGKSYSYINLLSGQDYPLQPVETIHHFLKANLGKAFMEYLLVEGEWTEAIPRLFKYHLAYYRFPSWNFFQRWLNAFTKRRKMPMNMIAVGRSQWFTITGEQMRYILQFLQKNPSVSRFFKLTWGADEFVFQTILYNSPYRKDMVNNNLRFIDWSGGGVSPKTFTVADADMLLASNKLYARKFSAAAHDSLLQLIDPKLSAIENQTVNSLTSV
jgi:hypothetical protein